jgi:hypothetical protein
MKRILNVLRLFVMTTAKDAYEEARENLRLTLNLVYVAIGLPLVTLVIGTSFGMLGYTDVARGFNTAAGFLGTVLLALVWIRAVTFGYIALFLAKGLKVATDDKVKIADQIEINRFAQWLRGITAWASGICLYAQLVPVWKHLGVSIVAATCIMIIAAIMSAKWFDSNVPKYLFAGVTVLVFLGTTLTLVSPKFDQAFQAHKDRVLGAERLNETDKDLLTQKQEERAKIRRRAVELCKGEYCTEADRAQVAKLDQDITDLQQGTYWERRTTGTAPAATAASKAEAPKAANGHPVADLPPPPAAPVSATKTTAVVEEPKAPPSSGTKEKAGTVCATYPELCSSPKGVAQKAKPSEDVY